MVEGAGTSAATTTNNNVPQPAPKVKKNSDRNYMAAVNSGDMETAQRMVDEAAKAAG